MMRLRAPVSDYSSILAECIEGITGNKKFKAKMNAATADLVKAGAAYISAGEAGDLYRIAYLDEKADGNTVVLSALLKSELVNLYETYFRGELKASRATYDKLLNSAHEQCPFCGGIGRPRNLDHFLPKAYFPQFSIFPQNLVPSCRDCNMDGKAENFATREKDQLIQPYVDHDRFFTTQWIFAKCDGGQSGQPISVQYFVDPPQTWSDVNKSRVAKHFTDFDLAMRYSIEAAKILPIVLSQVENLRALGLPAATIAAAIFAPGEKDAPFANHWTKGMFQALRDHFT